MADTPEPAGAAAPAAPPAAGERLRPRVGMGVFVEDAHGGGRVVIGQRINALGHGEWALPGGHLEHGEQFEECAAREVAEETGIVLEGARVAAVENVVFPSGHHYVVIFMRGKAPPGAQPRVLEPTKCRAWTWVSWDELPACRPMFRPLEQLLARGFRLDGGGAGGGDGPGNGAACPAPQAAALTPVNAT